MSKPTAAVVNRYHKKAYDRLNILIPKGQKGAVETFAAEHGDSVNGLVNGLLREALGLSVSEWKGKSEEQEPDA